MSAGPGIWGLAWMWTEPAASPSQPPDGPPSALSNALQTDPLLENILTEDLDTIEHE